MNDWKSQLSRIYMQAITEPFNPDATSFTCDYCQQTIEEGHTEGCQSPDAISDREAAKDREFDEKIALGYFI